jgi:peptide deformylase
MAIRQILKFGEDALRKKCRVVTAFDERLWTLIDDMKETLSQEKGAGLAAPQVGVLKRVVVIDVRDNNGVIELVNPEIIFEEGKQKGGEGCLSAPGEWREVERPLTVKVKAQDRNGNEFTMSGTGLLARAFCHEIDHLDGILFIDRV